MAGIGSSNLLNMTRRGFLGAAAAAGAGLLAGCGSSASSGSGTTAATEAATTDDGTYTLVEDGKLTVASDLAFPPFDSLDGDTPVGFDVDISKGIAEKLGLECSYLPAQNFDTIIPTIKAGGKADIGNSAFTITDERKEEIDFTDPYLDSNQSIATASTAERKSSEDLNAEGVKIAVQSGTTGEEWARENIPEATVVTLDDPIQCMTGVQQGLYDACVADEPVLSYLVKNSYTDCEVTEEIPTGEQYGIVVSKDNPNLTKAINKALAEMVDDGTMDSLQQQWFGTSL